MTLSCAVCVYGPSCVHRQDVGWVTLDAAQHASGLLKTGFKVAADNKSVSESLECDGGDERCATK